MLHNILQSASGPETSELRVLDDFIHRPTEVIHDKLLQWYEMVGLPLPVSRMGGATLTAPSINSEEPQSRSKSGSGAQTDPGAQVEAPEKNCDWPRRSKLTH